MKIKVHTFAYDGDNRGTGCEVFGSEKELKEHQESILCEEIDGDVSRAADEVRAAIADGKISEAWELWADNVRDPGFTFAIEEHEIEVPIVGELVEALNYALQSEYDRKDEARNFSNETLAAWEALIARGRGVECSKA